MKKVNIFNLFITESKTIGNELDDKYLLLRDTNYNNDFEVVFLILTYEKNNKTSACDYYFNSI